MDGVPVGCLAVVHVDAPGHVSVFLQFSALVL